MGLSSVGCRREGITHVSAGGPLQCSLVMLNKITCAIFSLEMYSTAAANCVIQLYNLTLRVLHCVWTVEKLQQNLLLTVIVLYSIALLF